MFSVVVLIKVIVTRMFTGTVAGMFTGKPANQWKYRRVFLAVVFLVFSIMQFEACLVSVVPVIAIPLCESVSL